MKAFSVSSPARLMTLYVVAGLAWIFGSDLLAYWSSPDAAWSDTRLSLLKGSLFILASGAYLFLLTRRFQARLQATESAKLEAEMKARREVERLKEMYATLAHANLAGLNPASLEDFLRSACQALVDCAGMQLAWIGQVDPERQTVTALALAGPARSYVNGLHISLVPDAREAQGPTGRAVAGNQTVISADTLRDERMLPWRDRLTAHGLRSSAAVPLRVNGQVWGCLSLYSGEAGYFTPEVVGLVEQLAQNLGRVAELTSLKAEVARQNAAIQANEKFLLDLIENSGALVFVKDQAGRYLLVNSRWEEATGLRRGEALGRLDADLFPPAAAAQFRDNDLKVMATGQSLTVEETLDGRRVFLSVKFPKRGPDGGVDGVCGMTTEVTALREAERRARELAEQLDFYLRFSPTVTYALEVADGRLLPVWVSENVFALTGHTPAETLTPDWWFQQLHPDDAAAARSLGRRVIHEGMVAHEYRLRRKQGDYIWVHDQLQRVMDEDRHTLRIVGAWTDVTERRLAEERLRLALRAANQGIYDLNVQTGVAVVSPEYPAMLGYDPATFQETNSAWIERLHPDDREAVAQVYRDYVAGRLPEYRVEFRQRTADGAWKWILSLGQLVERDAAGQPLRMIGTHTDITARKEAELELRRNTEILSRSVAELERFNRAAVGRELRMIELKREVNRLARELGQASPYPAAETDSSLPAA